MTRSSPLNQLSDLDGYRRLFVDADFWRPYVQAVCRRHGLQPCERVWTGVPGTCPAFVVEGRWLVKFFGRLFEGGRSYAAEREVARLLRDQPVMPVPALAAEGALDPPGADWPWPYLVFDYIDGASLGEVWDVISPEDRAQVARQVGAWTRALHDLPISAGDRGPFETSWEGYLAFLEGLRAGCAERHTAWGILPPRLCAQIADFIASAGDLILPGERPHLIHADLTADHLLGRASGGRWTSLAVIDFGDARTGSLFYELVALYGSLLHFERRLLTLFLEAYGYAGPTGAEFARRAMSACLQFEFNAFESPRCIELAHQAATLEEIAVALFE